MQRTESQTRKMNMARLLNRIALVSGGARGMGAAHARAIVAEGGKVVIGDLLDDEGKLLADELGDDAVYVHLDVTDYTSWTEAVALADSTFGGLNVLVNNAGILNSGLLEDYSQKAWDAIIAVNLTGQFLGAKAALAA